MPLAFALAAAVVAAAAPKPVAAEPVAPKAAASDASTRQALPRVGAVPGRVVEPGASDANAQLPWRPDLAKVDPRDLAATSADPAMRRSLAVKLAEQGDAHSFVLLLLLADDGDTGVRQAALEAVYERRCKRESDGLCNALIGNFIRDPERDIAWQARDWLLDRDLDLALEDADKAYKLDLLAKLGGSPTIPAGPSRHLLRCLSADADTDVQDNAAWLLEQQP